MPKGVYIRTEEDKKNRRIFAKSLGLKNKGNKYNNSGKFKKGMKTWNKGLKDCCLEETKKKMRDSHADVRGKNNPNWKNGRTKLILSLRTTKKYIQWISDVFSRDDWTCQTCNKRGCRLEAHHKERFSDLINKFNLKTIDDSLKCKELWDINVECHNLTKGNSITKT